MGNLAGWPYWKVISITGQSGAGTDYQVKLTIGDSAGGDFHLEGHCTNFPQDIRITDDDGTTLLDHSVEDITADPIIVHVEVKDDLGSNQNIRVYYGKSGETTASNGANTFLQYHGVETSSFIESIIALESSYIYECYGGVTSDTGYTDWGLATVQDRSDDTILIESYQAGNARYIFAENGTSSTSKNEAPSFTNGTKYKLRMELISGSLYGYVDDNQIGTGAITTNLPDDNMGIFMKVWSGSGRQDWSFTRKYNDPEPAFSSAGAEQTPGVPILTRLTTKGETIITLTIDERGNRVISNIITEYGDTVFSESRSYSDTLTIGDVKSYGISKVVTNVIGVLDTFSRTIVVTKAFTEIANVSDVIQNNMSRVLSNTISINDTLILLRKRILSEIISIADTLGSFNITKVISNSFAGFVDTVTRGFNVRILLETANVNDVVEKGIVRRAFGDAIGVVDTIIVTPIKSCIESIGVTDTLGAFSISKVIAEITNIIDTRVSSITKTPFNEEVSNTDIVSKTPIKIVDVEDITLSDVDVIKDVNHIESESISITESTTRFISMIVTEVCSIVDDISNTVLFIRTFAESITISDAISNVRKFFYEKRSKITNKLLQSSIVNKLLRSKVEGIKNSEVEQYED